MRKSFLLCFLLAFLAASCALPESSCAGATDKRCYDEYPYVLESSAAGEQGRTEAAGRVYRSTCEVDANQVNENQGKTDCKACRLSSAILGISCSQNDEYEYAGSDDLYEAAAPYSSGVGNTVCAHSGRITHCSRCTGSGDDCPQKESSDDTAEELADPVSASIFPAHAARESHSKCDCRVDVATGNLTDCVSHCYNGETESDCGTYYTCRSAASQEDGSAATHQGQHHCSDEFCKILFHNEVD